MQKVNRPQAKWWVVVFSGIGLLVILADQLTKTWVRGSLDRGQSLFDIGFFQITHVQNSGAAFGIFSDHTLPLIFVSFFGIIAILFLVFIIHRQYSFLDNIWVMTAVGLALGGMLGNQIDRLRLGYVTDFLDFKVWPAFNVSDASLIVGVIILACCLILQAKPVKHRE
jgi:signal peptidase II